ncbi:hypothetical protein C1H46_043419 [Malus baccata]|uniref:Uncharacterized protein n=1 Tax=Malus baccata TaxID=106549 RepID=A0A540K9Z1_MALBA|nr:hypothetical protein C1H46_043419 [Malus baccata]
MGLLGTSSRNRRSRRRSENETREEKVLGLVEEVVKLRKMRSKKEKLDLVLNLPSHVLVFSLFGFAVDDEYHGNLDQIRQLMTDLIMWRDVARSSLWFGLVWGRSSSFPLALPKESTLGLHLYPMLILLFQLNSGEPSMALKVAPFFHMGAESGHLITFWRLFMLGMPNF